MLHILKKLKIWLIGVHFVMETDANTLVAQLNGAAHDHPSAMLTRWLTWIRLFDFEVRHVKGATHTAADSLSRRPRHPEDTEPDIAGENNDEDWILAELGAYELCPVEAIEEEENEASTDPELERRSGILREMKERVQRLREDGEISVSSSDTESNEGNPRTSPVSSRDYGEDFLKIAEYVTTMKTPKAMDRRDFRKFKREALNYGVHSGKVWRLPARGSPTKLVIDTDKDKSRILKSCHDDLGHKGRESTYHRVSARYYWKGCYKDAAEYVKTCTKCQHRDARRQEEPLFPTASNGLMEKWAIDITYMPTQDGKKYLVVARDDMSGWVEARALSSKTADQVAKFIWQDIICRHGLFWRLVVDGGGENMKEVIRLLNKMEIQRIQVSAYNPKANGMIERGHGPIKNALSKMEGKWTVNLPAVLFADRTTTNASTGYMPFYLVYGREPILPVETRYPTWRSLFTEEIENRSKLIQLRATQFQLRQNHLDEAYLRKTRRRQEGKEAFDLSHNIRHRPLRVKDLVLRHDASREVDKSSDRTLDFRWLGPYEIAEVNSKGYYVLKELGNDGPRLRGTYAGNRLKLFHKRQHFIYSAEDEVSERHSSDTGAASGREDTPPADPLDLENPEHITKQHTRPDGIVIRVPVLTPEQRSQYRAFVDDSDE